MRGTKNHADAPIARGRRKRLDLNDPIFDPGLQDAATLYWRVGLAGNVIRWRERHGYSREKLAIQAGLSLAHLTDIESGMYDAVPYRLWCIAAALDMSAEELLAPMGRLALASIRSPMAG